MNYDEMNKYSFDSDYAGQRLTLNQYIARTFGWMFVGLTVTFALAWALAFTGAVFYLFAIPSVSLILLIAELAVVLVLSARIHKQSVNVSRLLFVLYSLLNGMVFSFYFVVYNVENVMLAFGLAALFFGAFALYGRFTRVDLSRLRPLLIGGVIFLALSWVVMLLFNMSNLERGLCMLGIVIFLCFTAYDMQKLKANYEFYYQDAVMLQKASIYSALELYLDFINLFLYLLRFLGRGRRR